MPRLEVDIAFMSPGQGAEISKSWARDPSSRKVVDETQKQLPHGPDMQELLSTNPEDRPINALNAHLLLAMVMGMARERLSFHLAKISYAFSGHSAGLPNILGISEFYNNGVPGLVASMERRSRILVAQQEIEPGEMDALVWKGVNNFKTMVDWVLEQNGYLRQQGKPESVWLACYNYATDKETQVVITSRKGTIGQIKEKFPEEYKSGKIVFRDINGELPANRDIVVKYQAGGSSLFVNAIKAGKDHIKEDIDVWRLVTDESQFINYFQNKLNKLLGN